MFLSRKVKYNKKFPPAFNSHNLIGQNIAAGWAGLDALQVNLFQKHSFLNQLTHNTTTDCSELVFFLY